MKLEFNVNLMRTVLWQYENAPKLKSLVQSEQDWANENVTEFWKNWFRDVFNLKTANDFGLSVWSRILDVPLTINRPKRVGGSVFGFGSSHKNFGNGNFGRARSQDIEVTTEQARKILLLRWFQLTSRPTVANINEALEIVFGAGTAYVQDNLDMSNQLFMFTERPDYQTIDLLKNTDLLPRPSAVGSTYSVQPRAGFGFGRNHLNFGNGNFSRREII
jgi:hypothetical protein